MQNAIDWMTRLNRDAARAMREVGVVCATDITGYGLLGHAYEIADASQVALRFHADALPLLDGALEYARQKQIPGGAGRNKLYLDGKVQFTRELADDLTEMFFDPQTSGGLLIAIAPAQFAALARALQARGVAHWVVGQVIADEPPHQFRIFVD